jgi:hypothetical protein
MSVAMTVTSGGFSKGLAVNSERRRTCKLRLSTFNGEARIPSRKEHRIVMDKDRIPELRRVVGRAPGVYWNKETQETIWE